MSNTAEKTSQKQFTLTTEEINKISKMIKPINFAMMTTKSDDGFLHSRPMAAQKIDFDGKTLWFFSTDNSPKCQEIKKDSHINVSFMDTGKSTFVSIIGLVEIVKDKAKMNDLWDPTLKAWFPQELNDPHICLLKVTVHGIEYWDQTSNRMTQLLGMAKSYLSGESYTQTPDVNKKIDMGAGMGKSVTA